MVTSSGLVPPRYRVSWLSLRNVVELASIVSARTAGPASSTSAASKGV